MLTIQLEVLIKYVHFNNTLTFKSELHLKTQYVPRSKHTPPRFYIQWVNAE